MAFQVYPNNIGGFWGDSPQTDKQKDGQTRRQTDGMIQFLIALWLPKAFGFDNNNKLANVL